MGNLKTLFRMGSKKSKSPPSTEPQPAPPTQDLELAALPAKTPTPPLSHALELGLFKGLAAYTLDECLPFYCGGKSPRPHHGNVWHDDDDRTRFIMEALVIISDRGTFRLDDKRVDLMYLSQNDMWYAQLAVIERGFVFGRPLKCDIPRPSKREAFLRLKHGVRRAWQTMLSSNLLSEDTLLEGLQLLRMNRLSGKGQLPGHRVKHADSRSSSLLSAPLPTRPRPTLLRSKSEPRRVQRFEALPPGSDIYAPQPLMSVAKLIREEKSAPDYLVPQWKPVVRKHARDSVITLHEEHSAGQRSTPTPKALGKRPVGNDDSYSRPRLQNGCSAEQLQQMIRAQGKLAPLPSPESKGQEALYGQILNKQQAFALSLPNHEGAYRLSIPEKDVYKWKKYPEAPHQQKPEGLVDRIPPPTPPQATRSVRFVEPSEPLLTPPLHSPKSGRTPTLDLEDEQMSTTMTAEWMKLQRANINEQTFFPYIEWDATVEASSEAVQPTTPTRTPSSNKLAPSAMMGSRRGIISQPPATQPFVDSKTVSHSELARDSMPGEYQAAQRPQPCMTGPKTSPVNVASRPKARLDGKNAKYMQQQGQSFLQQPEQSAQQPQKFQQHPQQFGQPQPQYMQQPPQYTQQPLRYAPQPLQYIQYPQQQFMPQPQVIVQYPMQFVQQPQPQVILQPQQYVQRPQQIIYQPQPVHHHSSRPRTAKYAPVPKHLVDGRARPPQGRVIQM